MEVEDIKTVHKALEEFGDDFWREIPSEVGRDLNIVEEVSNTYLFDEIVSCINKAGYDLILVKNWVTNFISARSLIRSCR